MSATVTESSQHIELHKMTLKIVSGKGLVRLPHLQTHKKQQVNNNNSKDGIVNVVGENTATTPVAWTFRAGFVIRWTFRPLVAHLVKTRLIRLADLWQAAFSNCLKIIDD